MFIWHPSIGKMNIINSPANSAMDEDYLIPIQAAVLASGQSKSLDQIMLNLSRKTGSVYTPVCKVSRGIIPLSRLSPDGGKGMLHRIADDKWVNGYLQLGSDELMLKKE